MPHCRCRVTRLPRDSALTVIATREMFFYAFFMRRSGTLLPIDGRRAMRCHILHAGYLALIIFYFHYIIFCRRFRRHYMRHY